MGSVKQINEEHRLHQLVINQRKLIDEIGNGNGNGNADVGQLMQAKRDLNRYEIELEKYELILQENPQRFVIFPIHFHEVWEYYKKQVASFWTAEEITLSDDLVQWKQGLKSNLSDNDKFFIKHVLAFFAASDGIVNENLAARFYKEVQIPEARCFVAGTPITLANGTSLPIEQVSINDSILGWDEKNNVIVPAKVIYMNKDLGEKDCIELTFEDGRQLICTPDHRILTESGHWIEADQLGVGSTRVHIKIDQVSQDVDRPTFNLLLKSKREVGKKQVFDLTIEDPINSFLANGVVVHNCFYGFQIAMENIHGEVYSLLIDTLVDDLDEKDKLLRAVENYPSIKKLSDWALKWLHSEAPFNQRLIAFACMEGILFSGPFCAIFWLKKRGLLPGLTFSNELISRDEGLHMDFACLLNSMLKYPATESTIIQIVSEAVEIEKEFICESLPCNLIGMNATEMTKYIEYVADHLLVILHRERHWKTSNPFNWMDLISTQIKTNFFEKRVGEYNRAKFSQSKINSKAPQNKSNIEILDEF